ncbi:MAG: hypothetical protein WKH64_00065 [Chloroflexia bacterium]
MSPLDIMQVGGAGRRTGRRRGIRRRTRARRGYTAAAFPLHIEHDENAVREYAEAARSADVVIAEVGAWSNSISADEAVQREAVELCCRRLALADRVGARCCVNISGSRGEQWDGPHPDNLSLIPSPSSSRPFADHGVHPTRTLRLSPCRGRS